MDGLEVELSIGSEPACATQMLCKVMIHFSGRIRVDYAEHVGQNPNASYCS